MKIKAIETEFKGYKFRSRLEARWAVFFETLGCDWEYEPEGFDLNGLYYLPDFKVAYPNDRGHIWFEVKSSIMKLTTDDIKKMTLFAKHVESIYLLDGTPDFGSYLNFSKESNGLVTDYNEHPEIDDFLSYTDFEMTQLNKHTLQKKENNKPSTRWGDVLYTHEDGGRIFYSNYGGDVDSEWETDLTDAVVAARSARFEHGQTPRVGGL